MSYEEDEDSPAIIYTYWDDQMDSIGGIPSNQILQLITDDDFDF